MNTLVSAVAFLQNRILLAVLFCIWKIYFMLAPHIYFFVYTYIACMIYMDENIPQNSTGFAQDDASKS